MSEAELQDLFDDWMDHDDSVDPLDALDPADFMRFLQDEHGYDFLGVDKDFAPEVIRFVLDLDEEEPVDEHWERVRELLDPA